MCIEKNKSHLILLDATNILKNDLKPLFGTKTIFFQLAVFSGLRLQNTSTSEIYFAGRYWLDYYLLARNKGMSGFTSNTLLMPKQDQFMV